MEFFNLDLEDLLSDDGLAYAVVGGKMVRAKSVNLDPPQLGMFDLANVVKYPDGKVELTFWGTKYAPNKKTMDFMAYCNELFGKDNLGNGAPSKKDVKKLREGNFVRDWDYVKMLQFKRENYQYPTIVLRINLDNQDMSSFINNLAKGFVRSAVNQVGRDGGRVISNSIYNGRNYVPISEVGEAHNAAYGSSPDGIPENAVSKTKPFSFVKILLLALASLGFIFIGSVCVFLYGISQYISTKEKVQWEEKVRQYARDRRYKSGARYVGSQVMIRKATVDATPEAIEINKKNGIVAMAIGGICTVINALLIWLN